eukprot:15464707-Alexandrium_andersonii.AAC.1
MTTGFASSAANQNGCGQAVMLASAETCASARLHSGRIEGWGFLRSDEKPSNHTHRTLSAGPYVLILNLFA